MKKHNLQKLAITYFAENLDQYDNMDKATTLTTYQMKIYDHMNHEVRNKVIKYCKGVRMVGWTE